MDSLTKLRDHLKQWQLEFPKLVIGLEGYSGAGKTTLVKELVKYVPAVVVSMDEFQVGADGRENLEKSGISKADMFVEKYRFESLKDLVKNYRNGAAKVRYALYDTETGNLFRKVFVFDAPLLILDGIWLSDDRIRSAFDKIVYLASDPATSDERRRKREGQDWAADAPEETQEDSYVKQYKMSHQRYMEKYRPDERADLILHSS